MSWPEATSASVDSRRPCGRQGVEYSACQSAMHPQPAKGGVFWRRMIIQSFEGLLVAQGLTTAEAFAQTLATAQADVDSPQLRCVLPFYISFGQRPAR